MIGAPWAEGEIEDTGSESGMELSVVKMNGIVFT
jgi:hypothetical protein